MASDINREEEGSTSSFITDITDKNELEEIANRVAKDKKVMFVTRQSRFKPGGSKGSPDTLFVTSQRLIVRNPSMMGMREHFSLVNYDKISSLDVEKGIFLSTLKIRAEGFACDIDAIDKEKAEKMLLYIQEKLDEETTSAMHSQPDTHTSNPQLSTADELTKIANTEPKSRCNKYTL
jgi:hypothetical protein